VAGATGIKCRTTTCGVAVDRVLTVSVSGEGAEIFDDVVLIEPLRIIVVQLQLHQS